LYQLELESGHQPETDGGVRDPPSGSAKADMEILVHGRIAPHQVRPDHAVLDAMNARKSRKVKGKSEPV
jgi:hypothetical protein